MRKCDICSTVIPFGEDRCPSCGFPYRPEGKLSDVDRYEKKEKYMSQFQPHPSPLDDLKKGEIPDFSKVYNTIKGSFNKQANRTIRPTRRKGNPFLIIPILIVFMILGTFIFGISYGFSQVFDEFNFVDGDFFFDSDYYEDEDYQWYYSSEELENMYPNIYTEEVKPYYLHMYNFQNETNNYGDITEMYGVEYGELYYASINAAFLMNNHDINAMLSYQDGEWFELYQVSKKVGSHIENAIDQEIIDSLSYFTQVDSEIIKGFLEDYQQQYVEGYTYKYVYSDDGGTFYFTYEDGFVHYEYENYIEITE